MTRCERLPRADHVSCILSYGVRNAPPQGGDAHTKVQLPREAGELLATAVPLGLAFVLRLAAAAN